MSLQTAPTTVSTAGARSGSLHRLGVGLRRRRSDSGEMVRLRDGARLLVRPIRPTDVGLLADAFDRLSMHGRWFRFLAAKKCLSHSELHYLTNVDHVDHEALIAIDAVDGRAVGVARYVRSAGDPGTADIAVTVVDAWHRRGVATVLLTRLSDRARRAGIGRYAVLVSTDNVASLELLRSFGFDPGVATVFAGMLEAHVAVPVAAFSAATRPVPG